MFRRGMDVFWPLLEGWCNPPSVCCLSWMSIDLSSLSSPSLNCTGSPCVSDESQLCQRCTVQWFLLKHSADIRAIMPFFFSGMHSSAWMDFKQLAWVKCVKCIFFSCGVISSWAVKYTSLEQMTQVEINWHYEIAVWLMIWHIGRKVLKRCTGLSLCRGSCGANPFLIRQSLK